MTTLEGFLSQQIGEPPRMTAGQKLTILNGANAAFYVAFPDRFAQVLSGLVVHALAEVPDSTACACCDFYRAGDCAKFESEIPAEWLPKGCKEFQDSGAPF